MAVLRDQAVPLAAYDTGVYDLPTKIINNAAVHHLYFEISRCTTSNPTIWPNTNQIIKYSQQVSFDNGQSWVGAGGFEAMGGIHVLKTGEEAETSTFSVFVPPEQNGRRRRLNQRIEIVNGPIYTQAYYELRDN